MHEDGASDPLQLAQRGARRGATSDLSRRAELSLRSRMYIRDLRNTASREVQLPGAFTTHPETTHMPAG